LDGGAGGKDECSDWTARLLGALAELTHHQPRVQPDKHIKGTVDS